MTLIKYEMKKLLFNKSRLILLTIMFLFYILLGFGLGDGVNSSEDAAAVFWNISSIKFDTVLVCLLLLMPLTFFISPLFTQEVRTEMDNIVLCSQKGRKETATAKLISAGMSSVIIALIYIFGTSIGTFIGYPSLADFAAPAQVLEPFFNSTLNISAGGAILLGSAWLVFAAIVLSLGLAFVSSKLKSQSAAFGIGLVLIVGGILLGNLGPSLQKILWIVTDFNFGALASFNSIFGGGKMYNFFGISTDYWVMALIAGVVISVVVCLLTYLGQRKRSAV